MTDPGVGLDLNLGVLLPLAALSLVALALAEPKTRGFIIRYPRVLLPFGAAAGLVFAWVERPNGLAFAALAVFTYSLWMWVEPWSFRLVNGYGPRPKGTPPPSPSLDLPQLMPGPIARPMPSAVSSKWLDPVGLERITVGTRIAKIIRVCDGNGKEQLVSVPDGSPWTMDLSKWHWLLAGSSGSGKSRLSWSILSGLGPHIKCGGVEVYAIDPKGGLEVSAGASLFKEFAHDPDDPDADYGWEKPAAELLRKVRAEMRKRARVMRANHQTKHVATPGSPHVIIWFDELAEIYALETKERDAILKPLRSIMGTGRAAGFNVIGCIQDPRAETLKFRPLFTAAVGLHLPRTIIDNIIEDGAREAGAKCDLIDKDRERGVAYIMEQGTAIKVRSYLLTDPDVERNAAMYGTAVGG